MFIDIKVIKNWKLFMAVLAINVVVFLVVPLLFVSSIQLGYLIAGILSLVSFVYGMILLVYVVSKKARYMERRLRSALEKAAIIDITPLGSVVAMQPVTLRLRVKNILDTFGMRLRFRSFDYFNPSNLHLLLEPGEEDTIDVIFIPTGSGLREFTVALAPLYNERGELIPEEAADDVDIQEFGIDVEETVVGGLSSRERGILSGLIKFATFLSASGLIYFSILRVSGLEALIFVLTQVVPIIAILQVPALMIFFYLDKKLPEKPYFKFEESESR